MKEMTEETHFVTKCLSCETINNSEIDLCSNCGIFLYNDEVLCSECLKLVKSKDEKCYSCGKNIIRKEEEEEKEEIYNFEIEEKEKFLEELKKKTHGIEIDYFIEELKTRLKFYPTIKLLFSDECPEKLAEHFEIEQKGKIEKKLERFVKSFFKTLELIIFGERYAQMVMSIIAYFWLRQHYNDLQENKGLLVLLKTESKYYEQVMGFSEDEETYAYIFGRMIINSTLQDILFAEQIERGGIRTLRAGAMFSLAEGINGNKGKSKDKIKIREDTEHFYINCINDMIFVLGYYADKGEWKKAATMSGLINEKLIFYGKKLRNYSIFKFTKGIFQIISDYISLIGKRTLNEEEKRVITQTYKLLEALIHEEDKEEGRVTSKDYTTASAKRIVKKLQDESLKKLLLEKYGEILGEAEDKTVCLECNIELEPDSNFCGHCGTKI